MKYAFNVAGIQKELIQKAQYIITREVENFSQNNKITIFYY